MSGFGSYSPDRRTALVLCGTGAHGAYHAGVLRALREVGVKADIMAGHGVGAASAALAAIDGAARLSDANGVWRGPKVASLYQPKRSVRLSAVTGSAIFVLFLTPLLWLLLDAVADGRRLAWVTGGVALVAIALATLTLFGLWRENGRRRASGAWWWRLIGAPYDAGAAHRLFSSAIWDVVKGAAPVAEPARDLLGRRYAEALQESLGQPGYAELLIVATDLDARRDLVAALLKEPYRQEFVAAMPGRDRRAEVLDLAGVARDRAVDVVAAALTPPVACEPYPLTFGADSFWRGETHRTCDRPGAIHRLLEEVAAAGATQAVVVSAVAPATGPHRLRVPRLDMRSRLGEFQAAAEASALRDAIEMARLRFDAVHVIAPEHNPVGPYDMAGAYDDASDRRQDLPELMEHAYADAYRQFIEPIVGASGEQLAKPAESGPTILD